MNRSGLSSSVMSPASEGESWRRGTWILEPLVYQDEALGYLLVSGSVGDPAVYDTLGEQLSSALKGALLMEQVVGHEPLLSIRAKPLLDSQRIAIADPTEFPEHAITH